MFQCGVPYAPMLPCNLDCTMSSMCLCGSSRQYYVPYVPMWFMFLCDPSYVVPLTNLDYAYVLYVPMWFMFLCGPYYVLYVPMWSLNLDSPMCSMFLCGNPYCIAFASAALS